MPVVSAYWVGTPSTGGSAATAVVAGKRPTNRVSDKISARIRFRCLYFISNSLSILHFYTGHKCIYPSAYEPGVSPISRLLIAFIRLMCRVFHYDIWRFNTRVNIFLLSSVRNLSVFSSSTSITYLLFIKNKSPILFNTKICGHFRQVSLYFSKIF